MFLVSCFPSLSSRRLAEHRCSNALRKALKLPKRAYAPRNQVLQFFAERAMSLDLYRKVQYVIRTEKPTDEPVMECDVDLLRLLPQRFRMQMHEAARA